MTIVNITHKFIFVHIPKTAGTSTKVYFRQFAQNCDLELGGPHKESMLAQEFAREVGLTKHSPARDVVNALGAEAFERYFSFSIVRDPFARTLSAFNFLKNNFRDWENSDIMDKFSTVEEFVLSDFFQEPGPDRMLEPQSTWLVDNDDRLLVKFIGHMESLEDDLKIIADKLSLPEPAQELERRNISTRRNDVEAAYALTPEVQDVVRARYESDFQLLQYPLEPSSDLLGVGSWIIEKAAS